MVQIGDARMKFMGDLFHRGEALKIRIDVAPAFLKGLV
jgi:hypothetical protein